MSDLNVSMQAQPSESQANTQPWNEYVTDLQQQQEAERVQAEEIQRILQAYPRVHRSLDPNIVYMIDNDLRVNKGVLEKLQWVPVGNMPDEFYQQGGKRTRRKRKTHKQRR